jgi:PP-loop superfamily ATP-utilizing enzyme
MAEAQRIVIRIKKGKDGRTSLSCARADGTVTWQRQEGKQAAFFPKHDLTHCAVESVLEQRQGFYGLVADGWDFSDFGTPWPRGRLPAEANVSEMIVGFFDGERQTGETNTATDLNRRIAEYCAEHGLPLRRELTEEDLTRVRQRRAELFAKWDAVEPGNALEIPFEVG